MFFVSIESQIFQHRFEDFIANNRRFSNGLLKISLARFEDFPYLCRIKKKAIC